MSGLKYAFRAALLAALPTRVARLVVNRLGYAIARDARVGLSWVTVAKLTMGPRSNIGHLNRLKGPGEIVLAEDAAIGNMNMVLASPPLDPDHRAVLRLGVWAKITHSHHVDLTEPITIGDYSTVAGARSQLWTHGYVHDVEGLGRYRIDGPITIENNVSIGTGAIIIQGVHIAAGITVGAGTVVAKDLTEPGLYVAGSIRFLPRPVDPDLREDLELVAEGGPGRDRVYRRRKS